MVRRLLLISNSTQFGGGYLEHCQEDIKAFLGERVSRILFVPYACADLDQYAGTARQGFDRIGYGLSSIHDAPDPRAAVSEAEAIFVGGGNTFRLLTSLYASDLLDVIRDRVASGMPYMGASAGSNVATPSIMTTNDMPIVYPPSFDALNLVPFQINPHFIDPPPESQHMGESRETRLREFHEMNDTVVVGIREGAVLRVAGDSMELRGGSGAVIFRKGQPRKDVPPGTDLSALLND